MPEKTEKELSDNSRGNWRKAISAVEIRNFGYAVALVQSVLKETPDFLEGRKLLRKAQIEMHRGKKNFFGGFSTIAVMGKGPQLLKKDPKAAMDLAEEILEKDPFNNAANHLLKDAAMALGHFETAVFALQTLIECDQKDTKTMSELGELYFAHGDADKALTIFNKILEITPQDLVANKRAKDAAAANTMKAGGWDKAKDYRDLIKNKEEAVAMEQKNRVVKDEASIAALLAELHQEAEAHPESIDTARQIAALYEQSEDFENAIAWYNYASELSKGADSWLLRKVADMQLKQIDAAVEARQKWLEEAGEDNADAPRVKEELAGLIKQKNDSMLDDARKRVERNPTDLLFRFELGEQLMGNGEFTEAIPELQKARNNPNVRLRAMSLLGRCYVGKGMLDLAAKQFGDAASEIMVMDATKKDILYQLGLLHDQMGHKDEALACFKQIYEVDYSYEDVAKRVESSYAAG
ncbi:MAG: tetratricopeptide repeat protein [Chthoniobacteraceae bacterium]|nr:tetratricopeptide repeat protein [Chthoniobacteraceae bacterium]